MATAYTVFYNKQLLPGLVEEGSHEPVPKAITEKESLIGTEAVLVIGPVASYKAVQITAENEKAAAEYARKFLGVGNAEGELKIAATANFKAVSSN